MSGGRRVLLTGVSRLWGAMLAQRLEADPEIEEIIAVDSRPPARELARTEFVQADIRHRLLSRLIGALGIDTVVHAGTILDNRSASSRTVHETNVIGTMNLLAACGGEDSTVRTVVVKSSTAVYGSNPAAPSFWRETMPLPPARDRYTRDLREMENYVADFATRNPQVAVTTLRVADVVGASDETPMAAYLARPLVPTVLGFDPRLQFTHEEDVVGALQRAVQQPVPGTFNLAGEGVVILSQAIRMVGHLNVPVLPFVATGSAAQVLRRGHVLPLPGHMVPLIQHGRVVDTAQLRERFGFVPSRRTVDCVKELAQWLRVHHLEEEPQAYEAELVSLLRSKARAGAR